MDYEVCRLNGIVASYMLHTMLKTVGFKLLESYLVYLTYFMFRS